MKSSDLLKQLESIYGWTLQPTEQTIILNLARDIGAGKVIEEWTEFQGKFPGHSVFKFMKLREVENYELPL